MPPPPPPPSSSGYGGGYGPAPYVAPAPPGELAGFWVRFGGYLLDTLLYGLLMLPFAIVGIVLIAISLEDCETINDELSCPPGEPEAGSLAGGIVVLAVGLVLVVLIYLRMLARSGQTWGRRIAGVQVVRADTGGPPGWGKAIGRSLFENVISRNLLYLGYLWMIWDGKKQTWHDKVAGTYVIRTR